MAKSKRYNPYEDAKNILKYKGNYHTAKQMGTNYDQYKEAAKPYYQNLRFNGYGDLADQFDKSDFIQAQELFKGLKPDTTVDDYFSSVAANALDNASNPQRSQTAEDLWKAYQNNDSQYNTLFGNEIKYDSNGNVVSGLGVNHYNDGRKMWDSFMNFDVTAQPYYQTIMDAYQLKGGNAARGEQASGAANNAGNIDSYAQANANRQQLAFTTAGIESALAAANQNQKNTLSAYGSVSDYLTNMGNQVNSRGSDLLNAYQNIYSTDSLERQNALNAASDLAQKEMQNKIDKYLADVGYDQAVYTANKNLEGSKYKADANTLAAQIAADADRYTAQQNYAAKVYASDTDKAIAGMQNGTNGTNSSKQYLGMDGNYTDAKTVAWQMYDAYKQGLLPDVTDAKGLADYMTALGMDLSEAMEWVKTLLGYDKNMFDSNPALFNSNSTSTSRSRTVGGGPKLVTDDEEYLNY